MLYTGPKSDTLTIVFARCERVGHREQCQSKPSKAGAIEAALEGELGATSGGGVGLDLKPKSPAATLASFACGGSVTGVLKGSVIGALATTNKGSRRFNVIYSAAGGKQIPESFEGGVKDTLTAAFAIGAEKVTAQTGLIANTKLANEAPLEIRATP
jgi:hypothetical protein